MAEFQTRDRVENVALNTPIPLIGTIRCPNGNLYHQNGTGVVILKGKTCNDFARYELEFTGNISIPTAGAISPIATAIVVTGAEWQGSRSIYTPTAVDVYGNVTSRATIDVPKGCCFSVSVQYVNGTVDTPAVVPTPTINVVDGTLSVNRVA